MRQVILIAIRCRCTYAVAACKLADIAQWSELWAGWLALRTNPGQIALEAKTVEYGAE